jgi:hypothetical protein
MNINIEKLYNELLYAVERKFPNETRHQTALRYIQEAEKDKSEINKLGNLVNGCDENGYSLDREFNK